MTLAAPAAGAPAADRATLPAISSTSRPAQFMNVSGKFTLNAPRDIVFFGKRHSRRSKGRTRNE